MSAPQKRSGLLQFVVIFAFIYLGTQIVFRVFFPDQINPQNGAGTVTLKAVDDTVKGGHHPMLLLKNDTDAALTLEDRCPMPPVHVFFVDENGPTIREPLTTEEIALPCEPLTFVAAHESVQIDLSPWKYSLFGAYGTYEVELPVDASGAVVQTGTDSQYREGVLARFSIHEAGTITQVFRTFITKPLLNFLILIASYMPDYSLGFAIIILTLIIKILLFIPTQHSMESQKRMQALQPKLDAIKQRYKDNPEQMSKETMKLWKEHKINPFQSCLPILIQFPILIGLFFTVRDGSILALSRHLIYEPYQNLAWTFGTDFFGLDLLEPNKYLFPPLLVILQYIQMKMSFAISKRKKAATDKVVDVSSEKKSEAEKAQQMQQTMMLYGLPLMIGFFAIRFEAAVSLYWGVSTVFAIGQQLVVNRKHIR